MLTKSLFRISTIQLYKNEDFLTAKGAEIAKEREAYRELLPFASFAFFAVFSSHQTES
jgi:hypothetical protein